MIWLELGMYDIIDMVDVNGDMGGIENMDGGVEDIQMEWQIQTEARMENNGIKDMAYVLKQGVVTNY